MAGRRRKEQRSLVVSGFSVLFLPLKVAQEKRLRGPVEMDGARLSALAAADPEGGHCTVDQDVAARQHRQLRHTEAGSKGEVHDHVISKGCPRARFGVLFRSHLRDPEQLLDLPI